VKIKPEILLNNNDSVLYNKILITGTDESFINHIRDYVIKIFQKKNYYIDTSGNYNKGLTGDLFSDKKTLFLLKDYSSKTIDFNKTELSNQSVLITSLGGKKNLTIKNDFSKSNDALVIECYPLNKQSKELILRKYINCNNTNISNDVFWYIVENFDNQFVIYTQQLETLNLLQTKIDSIDIVERAVFVGNKIDLSKLIFQVFKSNKYLINIFNKNIYSQTDFYIFLNSIKLYLDIVSSSNSREVALSKLPKYLFGEKDIFVKIYNKLSKEKILTVYKNISKVESLVRKNSNLYSVIGLRFLLNTKKIFTS
jgi:DNA polymerase III delta subunit